MEFELGLWNTIAFALLVALGSFTQAFSGFALGLIVMGAVTALGIAPISFTAGVISLVVVMNGSAALQGHLHEIDRSKGVTILAGLVPGVALGYFSLEYMDANLPQLLRLLLGLIIVAASLTLVFRPHPKKRISRQPVFLLTGLIGGFFGGLFNTSGPPIIYLLYRQPLTVAAIRATLLAIFWVAALWRSILLTVEGGYSLGMLVLTLICVPLVILTARLGRRLAGRLPELLMRRLAFALLLFLGMVLILPALLS